MKKAFLISIFFYFFYLPDIFAQQESSYLKYEIQSGNGFAVFDEDFNNCQKIDNKGIIPLSPKVRSVTIVQEDYRDFSFDINLNAGDTLNRSFDLLFLDSFKNRKKYSKYARCFWESNAIIVTDYDSKIKINGEEIATEIVRLNIPEGTYTLEIENGGYSASEKLKITKELKTFEKYLRPKKTNIYTRSLLPGYAQISKRQTQRGVLIAGLTTIFGASSLIYNSKISEENKNYEALRLEYRSASSTSRVLEIVEESEAKYDQIKDYQKKRRISLIGFVSVYLINIVDGIQPPKLGFREGKFEFNPYIEVDKTLIPKAKLEVRF